MLRRTALFLLLSFGTVFVIIGIFDVSAGFANSKNAGRCDPIGQIVKGSGNNFSEGRLVCRGDQLILRPNTAVQFRCFLNRETFPIQGSRVTANSDLCASRSAAVQQCGNGQNAGFCFVPKGPEEDQGGLQITQPKQTTISAIRPDIEWTSIAGADRYLVRLLGPNVSWESLVRVLDTNVNQKDNSTKSNRFVWASTYSPLEIGQAYRIVVIAKRGDATLSTDEIVVNVVNAQSNLAPSR